jgi:hypothetical protein
MFRVSWVDDHGEVQVNRGYRIQHSIGHRPLQGRPALPPLGEPVDPEVPGLRADLQERADHAAHGRRQGRLGLRSQGQEPRRSHALLPGLRERAVPPHRRRHRRAGRRHRRGRPRSRLHGRHDEEAQQPRRLRVHRQGPVFGGSLIRPEATGYGTVYFAEEMLKQRGRVRGPARVGVGLGQRGAVRGREGHGAGRQGGHRVRFQRHRDRRRRLHPEKLADLMESRTTCTAASATTPSARRQIRGRRAPVARAGGRGPALRHAERAGRQRAPRWSSRTACCAWPKAPTCRRPSRP